MTPRITDYLTSRRNLSLDADALAALQAQKLRATVRHAYQNVPYYRRLLDAAGVSPKDIRGPEDLRDIPISSKDDLLEAGTKSLIASNVPRSALLASLTTGTTGTAFTVLRTPRDVRRRKYLDLRSLTAIGWRPWEKLAAYTARRAGNAGRVQRFIFRTKAISALQRIEAAVAELSRYDPSFLWCYPSSFMSLLDYTDSHLEVACRPRVLVTTSEAPEASLGEACRQLGIEHFNFYGAVETGRIAWECRAHKGLHLNTDNVVLEIIPVADSSEPKSPDLGETVITTLNNEAMPFIRYRLGDLCRYLDEPCECGIALPLIEAPLGRSTEFVRLPSGRRLTARGLAVLVRQHDGVRELLIVQKDPWHIEISVVGDRPLLGGLAAELPAEICHHLGEPINVAVQVVESIEHPGPKARTFVSFVDEQ